MLHQSVFLLRPLISAAVSLLGWPVEDAKTSPLGNSFGVPGVEATYDYIVVGAGVAGATIATRLALSGRSVAVIEAGSFYELDNGNRTTVPGYDYHIPHPNSFVPSLIEYDFVTEPEPGLGGRRLHYTQGRTFGGTSATNLMGYQRGTVGSFDRWAAKLDDDRWKWDAVYPFYKQSVNFTPPDPTKIDPRRFNISYDPTAFVASGGPLRVSYGNNQQAYAAAAARGFRAMGLAPVAGLNSGTLLGYGTMTAAIDAGAATRESSHTSFLAMARRETDVKLYQTTTAKRVLFDAGKRATGVRVEARGAVPWAYELRAAREVIVSAGAFRSPQLLMASGIGPKALLDDFGIPVVADLRGVGQNIEDQVWFGFSYGVNVTTKTQIALGNPKYTVPAVEEYIANQSGPLAGLGGGEFTGWEKLPPTHRARLSAPTRAWLAAFPPDWPEVEYLPLAFSAAVPDGIAPDAQYMTFGAALLATRSRGSVALRSNDADTDADDDRPVVRLNCLRDPADREVAVEAFRRLRSWARGTGIVVDEFDPPAEVETDEEIVAWLRGRAVADYHAASGCAMGRDGDPDAVLDAQARVRGVEGLRVVDSSAMPILVPGHPMATIYMLAEKIANAIIKGDLE